jgi:putative membrane protein
MYTKPISVAPVIFKRYGKVLFIYLLYVTAVWFAYGMLGIEAIDIKMSIATILGFTVSLLLGFRTVSAYDRWWEARKVWGGIVNDSRTLVRQAIGFTGKGKSNEDIKALTHYMIAWCYALKNGLRKLDTLEESKKYLSKSDIAVLKNSNNKHNEILNSWRLNSIGYERQI